MNFGRRAGIFTSWRQGLGLALGLRPGQRAQFLGPGSVVAAMLLSLLVFAALDRWLAGSPAVFWPESLMVHAGYFLCVLLVAALACRGLARPAMTLTVSGFWLLATIPWAAAWQVLANDSLDGRLGVHPFGFAAIALACVVVLARCLRHVAPEAGAWRRAGLAVLSLLLLALPWQQRQQALLWGDAQAATESPVAQDEPRSDDEAASPPAVLHAESLLAAQPDLVTRATSALRPQTPGQVDLYAVGFAGDSVEPVFRNEVDYFDTLMSSRFAARGRVLSLVNSFDTVATTPLASLDNLHLGLRQIAAKMDPEEDVLLLFLTSHGSEDHELLVDLGDLPMAQVDPATLREVLDDAGIRWRVIVVSACYSGGFVPALRDERTLVITAARADRTSFGCGSDSEITWFGKAFLANALNDTTDFRAAYDIARTQIRSWEREDGNTPSWPQLWQGKQIGAKLDAWRATLPAAARVPFVPTVPAPLPIDPDAG